MMRTGDPAVIVRRLGSVCSVGATAALLVVLLGPMSAWAHQAARVSGAPEASVSAWTGRLGHAGVAGLLLAAAAVAIGLGLRQLRRLGAGLAMILLVVFAFEAGLHSAHHLGDPLRATACTVAVATAHLAAAPIDVVSIEPPIAPVFLAGRSAEPTPVTLHRPAQHESRAPPALTA